MRGAIGTAAEQGDMDAPDLCTGVPRSVDKALWVRTITTHPEKLNPFRAAVEAFPYDFDQPDALVTRDVH